MNCVRCHRSLVDAGMVSPSSRLCIACAFNVALPPAPHPMNPPKPPLPKSAATAPLLARPIGRCNICGGGGRHMFASPHGNQVCLVCARKLGVAAALSTCDDCGNVDPSVIKVGATYVCAACDFTKPQVAAPVVAVDRPTDPAPRPRPPCPTCRGTYAGSFSRCPSCAAPRVAP